ncbi:MAG: hypothetical protein WC205_00495 [Opitutaceae bacterium]
MELSTLSVGCTCSLAACLSVSAQLSSTSVPTASTGTDRTNSPYHTANGSFINTTWNILVTGDVSAGNLVWSDGTTATSGPSTSVPPSPMPAPPLA